MSHLHALPPPALEAARSLGRSSTVGFLRAVATEWSRVDATHLAAALAFYSVLSLAPFLLVIVAIAGWVLGSDVATHYVLTQIANVAGAATAKFIGGLVAGTHPQAMEQGTRALVGLAVTLAGATATFAELQHGLDRIFGERGTGALGMVRTRLLSFGLVIGASVLSICSLLVSAGVHAMLSEVAHADMWRAMLSAGANEIVSFAVLALAFVAILRVLPECPPLFRAASIGGLAAAGLFVVGKFAIGWYLAHFALASAYGAAGAIVVVMLWIYWSSALFFVGAVVARVVDQRLRPQSDAELTPAGLA